MGVTAIIVGASLAAGGSVAAAKIGSDASKNAANAQVQGNNAALNFAQQRFNVGQQALAPYQYGGAAIAGLGGQVNNQPQGAGNLLAGYAASVPNARSMALGAPSPQPSGMPNVPNYNPAQQVPSGIYGQQYAAPNAQPIPMGVSNGSTNPASGQPWQGSSGSQSGMVTVQAPTGETKQMPMAQAQQYVSKGARIIG